MVILLVPLQNGAGPYSQPLANLSRYGYLALSGELGFCERHGITLPR